MARWQSCMFIQDYTRAQQAGRAALYWGVSGFISIPPGPPDCHLKSFFLTYNHTLKCRAECVNCRGEHGLLTTNGIAKNKGKKRSIQMVLPIHAFGLKQQLYNHPTLLHCGLKFGEILPTPQIQNPIAYKIRRILLGQWDSSKEWRACLRPRSSL